MALLAAAGCGLRCYLPVRGAFVEIRRRSRLVMKQAQACQFPASLMTVEPDNYLVTDISYLFSRMQ